MSQNKYLIFATLIFLAGCESMSVPQCQVADWGRVGFSDGAAGVSESQLANYTEDCAKAGVQPNAVAYRQGWDAGVLRFCTAANGWREGLQGNSFKVAVCQGQPGYEAFAQYLDAGLRLHRTREHMRQNSLEINRLQKHLEETTSDAEKHRLREQLHGIDHEQVRLRGVMSLQQLAAP